MNRELLIQKYPIGWEKNKIRAFRKVLLDWYDAEGRELPWRGTKNPYYIWVSEIMLQQTQVNTVIPYYERFITELPEISDLSQVEENELMGLWQGLGYYSRARNMQSAAKQIMEYHDGKMPNTQKRLLSLKGIGPYTAGAIASIAFNLPEPALDGNLMRIITRLFEIDEDITLTSTKRKLTAILYQLIDPDRPGDFNQALMDIGATIMTPSNFRPINNPIKEFDQSYQNGTSHLYPVKKKKVKATEHSWLAYAVMNNNNEWLMRKHTEKELLTGLWHFPLIETSMIMEEATDNEIIGPFLEKYGGQLDEDGTGIEKFIHVVSTESSYELLPEFPRVKHIFSHRKWDVQVIPIQLNLEGHPVGGDLQWVKIEELGQLPISTLQQKLFKNIVTDRH